MKENNFASNNKNKCKKHTHRLRLRQAEAKLIEAIRAIAFGEIEGLKIKDGLPIGYKSARKTRKFE